MQQPCTFINVDGRSDLVKCSRKGCKQPEVIVPIRGSTGKHWEPGLIWRFCDVLPDRVVVLPPLYRRAWSFAKAWWLYWWSGRPATEEHLRDQRLAICKGCDQYQDATCIECGCPITDKRKWLTDKLSMATEHCPVAKWGAVELAPSMGITGRIASIRAWAKARLATLGPIFLKK